MTDTIGSIIPTPKEVIRTGEAVAVCDKGCGRILVEADKNAPLIASGVEHIKCSFLNYAIKTGENADFEINIKLNKNYEKFNKSNNEAYFIEIKNGEANIIASDEPAAYMGAVTLSKLIYENSGKVYLPKCTILDYPRFGTRGFFMECRYGSDFMSYEEWRNAIDYLSEMKINKIVCGIYGCWDRQYDGEFAEYLYIPFKNRPELNTPRNIKYYSAKNKKHIIKENVLPDMFENDYFGKICAYAKDKNIEFIPLFNSLGHNTLLPRVYPEISAVDEKGNYQSVGFCTNNPKTYEILFDLYDQIIDKYLTPNGIKSFQIGLDEVWNMIGINPNELWEERSPFCQCEKCRGKNYGELMVDYIINITKHMKSKGIENVYVYHDMLFSHNLLTKELAERLKAEGVYDNIIIDWWDYHLKGNNFKGREAEIATCFRSTAKSITGYFHWSMPTQMNENIYVLTSLAEEKGFEGMLAYSAFEYCYDFNYLVLAECAWRGNEALSLELLMEKYAKILCPENSGECLKALDITNDIMLGRYSGKNLAANFLEYYTYSYLQRGKEYPQDYPARPFGLIAQDEEKYLSYLKDTYSKAKYAYDFFDKNCPSGKGGIWKLIAAQYRVICNEFLTMYTTAKLYNDKIISKCEFISTLCELIKEQDEVIALCEDVRIKGNQYTVLRDMTVIRQAILDLSDYLKSHDDEYIDLTDYNKYLSKFSTYLR